MGGQFTIWLKNLIHCQKYQLYISSKASLFYPSSVQSIIPFVLYDLKTQRESSVNRVEYVLTRTQTP
ncbi:hypothetical protein ACRRTK_017481 [Alexandromys fortis]